MDLTALVDAGLNVQTAALIWFAVKFEKRLSVIETALVSLLPIKN